ncbi:MAG TPA: glutamine-hydrolyzing GMP synthase [Gammaproteobacteria bacterium]|nr:glutamine-hydrolyzing GMP synthase [Gammaproteobacteria bacterium]
MTDLHTDRVLILDFGSQYTQLIARSVREIGVYCEILPYDVEFIEIQRFSPKGVILSGGPESAHKQEPPQAPPQLFTQGWPLLGICYGMQTMATQLGGRVEASVVHEYGHARVRTIGHSSLLDNLSDSPELPGEPQLDVWMSHGDRVAKLPPGFSAIAATDNAPLAGIADETRHFYGLQFHPEVTHTLQGRAILKHFVADICGSDQRWTVDNIINASIADIRARTGDDEVILGLSGGVDSSVVAALLQRAIGDRLTCIFVDNGLLRLHEGDQVMATFAENLGVRVIRINAEQRFLTALRGITDPEHKRKVIGNLFIEVFQEQAELCQNAQWLAQGTIYPDVIESAGSRTGKAKVIKSHHNVGGLPENMRLRLLEPLRELFKDEVRRIGVDLGLPHSMVFRHPFPGPGLAVRILGEVKKTFADILRQADAIFIQTLYDADLYDKVSQAFAVFLPVKSVGVVGDHRAYDYVITLRAVETVDFMTANWARLPYDVLAQVSSRIINEVPGVSRVAYDISGKPPATIEWE